MEGMKWINMNGIKMTEDERKTDIKRKQKPINLSLGGKCTIKNYPFRNI